MRAVCMSPDSRRLVEEMHSNDLHQFRRQVQQDQKEVRVETPDSLTETIECNNEDDKLDDKVLFEEIGPESDEE